MLFCVIFLVSVVCALLGFRRLITAFQKLRRLLQRRFEKAQQLSEEKPMFEPVTGEPAKPIVALAPGSVVLVGPCQKR